MKSKLTVAILSFLCGAAAVMLLHHSAANAPPAVAPHGVLPAALDRHIARVQLHQVPLLPALQTLSKETGCPIAVRWPALLMMGVNETTPVDADWQDVPLSAALKGVLSEAAAGFTSLDFRADGEAVLISTTADLTADEMVLRVYDVSGVVRDVVARRASEPTARLAATAPSPAAHIAPGDDEQQAVDWEVTQVLDRRLLVAGIWGRPGPQDAQFYSYWNGRLAVFHTPQVQAQVRQALADWGKVSEGASHARE